ncbi:MAG: RNA ligase [Nitrospirota bacterium]
MKISIPSFINNYLSDEAIEVLQKKKALHLDRYKNLSLVRLTSDFRSFPRGTVFHEKGFIPGYRRIMRVMHLENGINRYYKKERFYVEEKVDGYNARVAVIDGTPVALSRGGFICPFTTSRIPDLIDMNFFKKYPGFTINGEVVGPGNPYNTEKIPYVKEDVVFFAFDLSDRDGRILPPDERCDILQKFRISQSNSWGPFNAEDIKKIKEIVLHLNNENREGIVIKSLSNEKTIKYVTLSSCLNDLLATASLMAELPAGFYVQRILRAVFFSREFGIKLDDYYLLNSARALYLSHAEVLEEVDKGGNVTEDFQINVKDEQVVYELMNHFNRLGIISKLFSVEKTNKYYVARFQKIYTKGSKDIRRKLNGHGFFD